MLEQMESRLDSNKNGRIDQDKNERIDPDKNGRLETSKNVRLETSKNGTLDSSKNGRLETSKNGRHDGGVAVSNGDPSGPRGSNGTGYDSPGGSALSNGLTYQKTSTL